MSQIVKKYVDIGSGKVAIVSTTPKGIWTGAEYTPITRLMFLECDGCEDGAYVPAKSFWIDHKEAEALYHALKEVYEG